MLCQGVTVGLGAGGEAEPSPRPCSTTRRLQPCCPARTAGAGEWLSTPPSQPPETWTGQLLAHVTSSKKPPIKVKEVQK